MKYIFSIIAFAVLFVGCSTDDDQAEIDENIIKQYLSDNNLESEKHSSGLYYRITEPGGGSSPDINSNITIRYKGYFISGEVFDETTGNSTATFPLSALIQGWQIGIPLLKHGGSGQFFILRFGIWGSAKRKHTSQFRSYFRHRTGRLRLILFIKPGQ
ncbi:MAG: hypothetical protein R2764_03020 [Bacteroidales bacterium]